MTTMRATIMSRSVYLACREHRFMVAIARRLDTHLGVIATSGDESSRAIAAFSVTHLGCPLFMVLGGSREADSAEARSNGVPDPDGWGMWHSQEVESPPRYSSPHRPAGAAPGSVLVLKAHPVVMQPPEGWSPPED